MIFKRLAAILLGLTMTIEALPAFVSASEIDLVTNDTEITESSESDDKESNETPKPKATATPKPTEKPKETEKPAETTAKEPAETVGKKDPSSEDKASEPAEDKKPSETADKEPAQSEDKAPSDRVDNTSSEPEEKMPAETKETGDAVKPSESESSVADEKEPAETEDKKTLPESEQPAETVEKKDAGTGGNESEGDEEDEKTAVFPPQTYVFSNKTDNDQLLDSYFKAGVETKLNKKKRLLRKGSSAGDRLNGNTKKIYDIIRPLIEKVAKGEIVSTKFEITPKDLGLENVYFTADELGFEILWSSDTALAPGVYDAMKEKLGISYRDLDNALLADCPLELYWFDKTVGFSVLSFGISGTNEKLRFIGKLTLGFRVSADYASDEYSTDSDKISRVNTAVDNAAAIVAEAKNLSDYGILDHYRQKICDLVSYDYGAAHGGADYGDPWQLISVFDNDSTSNVVCEGYSKAFMYLCELTTFNYEVSCITVTGDLNAANNGHMWNVVRMDNGKNYLVDVTNCDTSKTGSYSNRLFMVGYTNVVGDWYQFSYTQYIYDEDTLSTYNGTMLDISKNNFNSSRFTIVKNSTVNGTAEISRTSAYADTMIEVKNVNPANGYMLDYIAVNDEKITGKTFVMPAENVTVDVVFKKIEYSVSVAPTVNGTAKLSKTSAESGEAITVEVKPDPGYMIDKVTVYGVNLYGDTFTFTMEPEDTVVTVTFKQIMYNVTVDPTTNGTASVLPDKAGIKDVITVSYEASAGYELDYIEVNGTKITGSTFEMPADNVNVKVVFKEKEYKATVNQPDNGSAYLSKNSAKKGEAITVYYTADPGYELDKITVYGQVLSGRTFTMGTGDAEVTVTFKKTIHSVELYVSKGSAQISATTAVIGDEIEVYDIKSATGYEFDEITVNGTPINGRKFRMGPDNVTVVVSFKPIKYKVTINEPVNGTARTSVNEAGMGDAVYVEYKPAEGYELDSIRVNNGDPLDGNVFYMDAADAKVTVTFKKIMYTVTVNAGPNGSASVTPETAGVGDKITISVTPDEGYFADTIKVNGEVKTEKTFDMPAANVTVEVVFSEIMPETVGNIITAGSYNYKVTNNDMHGKGTVAFAGFAVQTSSVSIPSYITVKGITYKVTRIASTAFKKNTSVTSVYIGSYVTTIDSYAFLGCTRLTKVSGGARLKTIGYKAFGGCYRLKSFSITSTVLSKIGNYAFSGDKALKTINVKKTTKLTKKGVKKSLKGSKVKTVKVKKSKVKKYKKYFTKKNCGRKVKVKK